MTETDFAAYCGCSVRWALQVVNSEYASGSADSAVEAVSSDDQSAR